MESYNSDKDVSHSTRVSGCRRFARGTKTGVLRLARKFSVCAAVSAAALLPACRPGPAGGAAPPRTLRIALCQYGTRLGGLQWNIEHAYDYSSEAFENGAHFVVLPEFSFHGFVDIKEAWLLVEELERTDYMRRFSNLACWHKGYLLLNHPARDGDELANESVLLGPDGKVVARYRKRRSSRIDRLAGFSSGDECGVFDLPWGKTGMLICMDIKGVMLPEHGEADLIVAQLAMAGVWTPQARTPDYVCEPISNLVEYTETVATRWAKVSESYVVLVNKTGLEHSYAFIGNSLAVTPSGEILAHASSGPGIVYADLPLGDDGRLVPD